MSIDPTVRPAHIFDMSVVLDLDAQYRSLLLDQRGGIAWLAEHVPLITLPPQDVVENSFIGEIDGAVIGFYVAQSTSSQRVGWSIPWIGFSLLSRRANLVLEMRF